MVVPESSDVTTTDTLEMDEQLMGLLDSHEEKLLLGTQAVSVW